MGYLNEFPNTNFYEQDLGFLIKAYKELSAKENTTEERLQILESIYTKVTEESKIIAKDTTLEQLKKWLEDGTLQSMLDIEYVVCIGDSYLKGTSATDTIKSWGGYLCDYMNLIENTNFFSFAEGGSGFYTNRGTSAKRFIDILKDNESKIDKSKVTKLIVGGGFNDATAPYAELISYIRSFLQYVNNNYPNAEIYIAFLGWDSRTGTTARDARTNLSLNTLYAYTSATRFAKKVHTIVCNDVLKQSYYMSTDGYHPNANGYVGLAMSIYNSMNNNYVYNSLSQTEKLKYGLFGTVYEGIAHSIIRNKSILYKLDQFQLELETPTKITKSQFPNFITNTQNSSNTGSVNMLILFTFNNNTNRYITCRLSSDDNNTSLLIPEDLENVTKITIPAQYILADISQTLLLEVKE